MWGAFSIVWGLAMALATLLLYKYKDRSDRFPLSRRHLPGRRVCICAASLPRWCSAPSSGIQRHPFNLGGRINLLYCFFWGFAAVVWFRVVYPPHLCMD